MEKISVKNYRSIIDSEEIELKPITAIVGRNSAGKSSFVRLFPLLKQTLERKTSDSILWYGDYVDLGDFKNALNRYGNNEVIEMTFSLRILLNSGVFAPSRRKNKKVCMADVTISIKEKFFNQVLINIFDQKIRMEMLDNQEMKIYINDDNTMYKDTKFIWYKDQNELIPNILQEIELKGENKTTLRYFRSDIFDEKCNRLIYGSKSKESEISSRYYSEKIFNINLGTKKSILESIKRENSEKFESYTMKHKRFIKINNLIIAKELNRIVDAVNRGISEEFRQTNYVKPIRARVDRYYRVQGISIEELDADGSNLPMILHNMKKRDLDEFEKWSNDKFGVAFSVTDEKGHVSLVIKDLERDSIETNLADTGYGYSQMLPIVVLLWTIHKKKNTYTQRYYRENNIRQTKTIVIEQPELHLHPAYQAKMIDVFINIINEANDNDIDLKIIFETHSESMINRLGKLIGDKKIDAEKINVLVFDKINGITRVESKAFNEKGLLKGWPVGFFNPEEDI